MDSHALRRRGWTISALARDPGNDRMIIRSVVVGKWAVVVRGPAAGRWRDPFAPMRVRPPHRRRAVSAR